MSNWGQLPVDEDSSEDLNSVDGHSDALTSLVSLAVSPTLGPLGGQPYYVSFLSQLLSEEKTEYRMPTTYLEYDRSYYLLHNCLDFLISQERGWVFGEKHMHEYFEEDGKLMDCFVEHRDLWEKLREQSPDHFEVDHKTKTVTLFADTAVSKHNLQTARVNKRGKYALLVFFLRINGYEVPSLDVMNCTADGEGLEDVLFRPEGRSLMNLILRNFRNWIQHFNETSENALEYLNRHEGMEDNPTEGSLTFDCKDLLSMWGENIPGFENKEDFRNFLSGSNDAGGHDFSYQCPQITEDDNNFLRQITTYGIQNFSKLVNLDRDNDVTDYWRILMTTMHEECNEADDVPNVLPLPIVYNESRLTACSCDAQVMTSDVLKQIVQDLGESKALYSDFLRNLLSDYNSKDATEKSNFDGPQDHIDLLATFNISAGQAMSDFKDSLTKGKEILRSFSGNQQKAKDSSESARKHVETYLDHKRVMELRKVLLATFTPEEKRDAISRGLGRKAHEKKILDLDPEADLPWRKFDRIAMSPFGDCGGIEKIIVEFNKIGSPMANSDLSYEGLAVDEVVSAAMSLNKELVKQNAVKYANFVEMVFTELSINSTRSCQLKGGKFRVSACKDSSTLIISPATAVLRTGNNPIWFMVVSNRQLTNLSVKEVPSIHYLNEEKTLWRTNWLSTDAGRLGNQLRACDRLLLSSLTIIESKTSPGEQVQDLVADNTTHISLACLTLLEDKITTADFLGDAKQVLIKCLSPFSNSADTIAELNKPIRSGLHLYFFRTIAKYSIYMSKQDRGKFFKFFKPKMDQASGSIDDTEAGMVSSIRSIFSTQMISFRAWLSELVYTHLHNKDRTPSEGAATTAIVSKLFKEHIKTVRLMEKSTNLVNGYSNELSDTEYAKKVISDNKPNMFSARAVCIGGKLQTVDPSNSEGGGLAYERAIRSKKLSADLSEFATFKASLPENSSKQQMNEKWENFDDCIVKVGVRKKAFETILDLLEGRDDDVFRIIDFANDTIKEMEVLVQLFRKQQQFGTREISILNMTSRLCIKVSEIVFEYINSRDRREKLTSGRSKVFELVEDLKRLQRLATGEPTVYRFQVDDMSKWNQRFVCIQFAHMISANSAKLGNFFPYITCVMQKMMRKRVELPKSFYSRCMEGEISENSEEMKFAKEKFLSDGKFWVDMVSSMLQGICHSASSTSHIMCLSLRDEIFSRMKKVLKVKGASNVKSSVSSDDLAEILQVIAASIGDSELHALLFHLSTEVSHRLFNIWKSGKKSSEQVSFIEFNQSYQSWYTCLTLLLKFGSVTVDIFCTDSFPSFVFSSFSAVEKLRENGASGVVTLYAHLLNKRFIEALTRTNRGGENDPSLLLNVPREMLPYDLGVYPLLPPHISELGGAEFWNYRILKMNEPRLIKILSAIYWQKPTGEEVAESLSEEADHLFRRHLRIEAVIGVSKQLEFTKDRLSIDREDIMERLSKDPLLLLRKPKNKEETILCSQMKLITPGAAESFRRTATSLYYARMTAFAVAKAFRLRGTRRSGLTYKEAVILWVGNLEMKKSADALILKGYFTRAETYEELISVCNINMKGTRQRPHNQTQKMRNIHVRNRDLDITMPLHEVLSSWIPDSKTDKKVVVKNDAIRALANMKLHMPELRDTAEETLIALGKDSKDQEALLSLIVEIRRRFSRQTMTRNYVLYGKPGPSVRSTAIEMLEKNSLPGHTILLHAAQSVSVRQKFVLAAQNKSEVMSFLGDAEPISSSPKDLSIMKILDTAKFLSNMYIYCISHNAQERDMKIAFGETLVNGASVIDFLGRYGPCILDNVTELSAHCLYSMICLLDNNVSFREFWSDRLRLISYRFMGKKGEKHGSRVLLWRGDEVCEMEKIGAHWDIVLPCTDSGVVEYDLMKKGFLVLDKWAGTMSGTLTAERLLGRGHHIVIDETSRKNGMVIYSRDEISGVDGKSISIKVMRAQPAKARGMFGMSDKKNVYFKERVSDGSERSFQKFPLSYFTIAHDIDISTTSDVPISGISFNFLIDWKVFSPEFNLLSKTDDEVLSSIDWESLQTRVTPFPDSCLLMLNLGLSPQELVSTFPEVDLDKLLKMAEGREHQEVKEELEKVDFMALMSSKIDQRTEEGINLEEEDAEGDAEVWESVPLVSDVQELPDSLAAGPPQPYDPGPDTTTDEDDDFVEEEGFDNHMFANFALAAFGLLTDPERQPELPDLDENPVNLDELADTVTTGKKWSELFSEKPPVVEKEKEVKEVKLDDFNPVAYFEKLRTMDEDQLIEERRRLAASNDSIESGTFVRYASLLSFMDDRADADSMMLPTLTSSVTSGVVLGLKTEKGVVRKVRHGIPLKIDELARKAASSIYLKFNLAENLMEALIFVVRAIQTNRLTEKGKLVMRCICSELNWRARYYFFSSFEPEHVEPALDRATRLSSSVRFFDKTVFNSGIDARFVVKSRTTTENARQEKKKQEEAKKAIDEAKRAEMRKTKDVRKRAQGD